MESILSLTDTKAVEDLLPLQLGDAMARKRPCEVCRFKLRHSTVVFCWELGMGTMLAKGHSYTGLLPT